MIVLHHSKGWKIISHYTHGLLAGKFAEQLDPNLRPEYWMDTLTAIIEHDDHLLDFEKGEYLTENGSPKDFMMNGGEDEEALEHAKLVYGNSVQKSQMVGLLVGRHLQFLYEDMSKNFAPMKKFLSEIRKKAKIQRKLYGISKTKETAAYEFMRFCDRCSLILCQDTVPETGRQLEINRTIAEETYYIQKTGKKEFSVRPWPFANDGFSVEFEYRLLEKPAFKDKIELKKEVNDADVFIKTVQFVK